VSHTTNDVIVARREEKYQGNTIFFLTANPPSFKPSGCTQAIASPSKGARAFLTGRSHSAGNRIGGRPRLSRAPRIVGLRQDRYAAGDRGSARLRDDAGKQKDTNDRDRYAEFGSIQAGKGGWPRNGSKLQEIPRGRFKATEVESVADACKAVR